MLKRLEVDKELCKDFIRSHGQKETVLQIQRASREDVCKAHLEREGERKKKPHKAQTASFLHCPWLRSEEHFRWINHREKQWDKSPLLLRLSPEGLRCSCPTSALRALASGLGTHPARPRRVNRSLGSGLHVCLGAGSPRDTPLRVMLSAGRRFYQITPPKVLSRNRACKSIPPLRGQYAPPCR